MANKHNSFENQHDQSNLYQKKKKKKSQIKRLSFFISLLFLLTSLNVEPGPV